MATASAERLTAVSEGVVAQRATRSPTPPGSVPEEVVVPRVLASAVPQHQDQHVVLEGWVHRRRRHSTVTFLILRDRTGLAQVVASDARTRSALDDVGEETVVRVAGRVVASSKAPGGCEVVEPVITLLSDVAATPPVELWRPTLAAGLPVLLDNAAVTWRHPTQQAVWRVAAASMKGFRQTLDALDFVEIATPKLVGTSTESGANVFSVDYFGRRAYLAQSPQLYKQAMVGALERVYEVAPVFRAEPHDTVRHLAEYVSLDAELGYIADHHDVVAVVRQVLAGMVDAVRETGATAQRAATDLPDVPAQLPVVHFADALQLVGADPDEPDLAPEHERALGRWARDEHGSDFLVVEGYPAAKRPFYTHPQPSDPRWTNSFDVLFRGLELITGGQRLHRYDDYLTALAERQQPTEPYAGYLQAFRHGMPPHGGFALGLERWVAQLIGSDNVRRTTLFPRDLHRLEP
jgi:nondiscriminating aspartyl-tRNA synthetase